LRDAHVGLPEEKIKGCLALKKLQIEPVPMGFLIDFSPISHRFLTDLSQISQFPFTENHRVKVKKPSGKLT
jgi:hypothetical protein